MTLLFAGHDTTTSTVAFLFYELARNPRARSRTRATRRRDDSHRRDAAQVPAGLHRPAPLDRAVRVRRRARSPAARHVHYCSWASHHLPDVWPEPERFDPQRFAPERKARADPEGRLRAVRRRLAHLHRDALRPGRDRASIAPAILERFRLELVPGYELEIRQMPTIAPQRRAAGDGPPRAHARGRVPGARARGRCVGSVVRILPTSSTCHVSGVDAAAGAL